MQLLQTENLDLSMICGLVDATLHILDDTHVPSVNWVLELLDDRHSLEEVRMGCNFHKPIE